LAAAFGNRWSRASTASWSTTRINFAPRTAKTGPVEAYANVRTLPGPRSFRM
jgi:hypothetical protein